MNINKKITALIAIPLIGLSGVAIASATIPDSSGTIHSCYSGGLFPKVRIIDNSSQSCGAGETPLNWAQNGGSYFTSSPTDTITTDSSGVVTHIRPTDLVATCNGNDFASSGVFTDSGPGASLIYGVTSFTNEGEYNGTLSSLGDGHGSTTGLTYTVGTQIGLPNANVTVKLYALCTPVPSLPSL